MRGKTSKSQTKKQKKLLLQQSRQLSMKQALVFWKTCNAFLTDIIQEAKIDIDNRTIQRYLQPLSKLEEVTLQSLFFFLI